VAWVLDQALSAKQTPAKVTGMKDEYDFSTSERGKFFRKGATVLPPVRPELQKNLAVDVWFARLDELGGRDFLPNGISDEPSAKQDKRKFLDE
jgi:hypothetical protein